MPSPAFNVTSVLDLAIPTDVLMLSHCYFNILVFKSYLENEKCQGIFNQVIRCFILVVGEILFYLPFLSFVGFVLSLVRVTVFVYLQF